MNCMGIKLSLKPSIIVLILPVFFFFACDPGYGVYLANKTEKEISVKVTFNDHQRPLNFNNDSIFIYDTLNVDSIDFKYSIKAFKDSSDGSYNFIIPQFKIAFFEGGQGVPDYNQKIIVNRKERLSFRSEKHLKKTGNFMSKKFIFTVK
jgi:hypothetical protein